MLFPALLLLVHCAGSLVGSDALAVPAASALPATVPAGAEVAVIGSTGKLGRRVVEQLVASGYRVRCLARPPAAAAAAAAIPSDAPDAPTAAVAAFLGAMPGVTLVEGDVTDAAAVAGLLDGCAACLAVHGATRRRQLTDLLPWVDPTADPTHAKSVNYDGVRHVINAARASGTCRRVVRITGKGEAPWSVFSILINGLGCMAKAWNFEGETLLRDAGGDVGYTIIRPGVMSTPPPAPARTDAPPPRLALADNGGDLPVASISHASIAALCVACLAAPNAAGATLCAMTAKGDASAADGNTEGGGGGGDAAPEQQRWAPLLATVAADTRSFPRSLLAEHERATRVGGGALVGVAAVAAAAALATLRAVVVVVASVIASWL